MKPYEIIRAARRSERRGGELKKEGAYKIIRDRNFKANQRGISGLIGVLTTCISKGQPY